MIGMGSAWRTGIGHRIWVARYALAALLLLVGLQRLLNDLATHPILAYVSLQAPDLTIVAHTESARLGTAEEDLFLRQALAEPGSHLRTLTSGDSPPLLEVARPFSLGETTLGLLRVGLKTEHITGLWRRALLILAASSLGLLAVGGTGMHLVFQAQARHHERVRALERALARQERLAAMGHLAAGVAHEVRNPLNAIGMGIQRLQGEFSPSAGEEEFRHLCTVMRGEVARLNTIVQNFLQLARAPALQRESVGVAALLDEGGSLMEADANAHAVHLTLMNGIQLLMASKHLNPEVPVVLITAYGSIASAVEAMKAGA